MRKTEVIFSTTETIKDYRNANAVSYSLVKSILSGNIESLFKDKNAPKSKELVIGSIVDHLLTMATPLEDEYAIYTMPLPKATILPVIEELVKTEITKEEELFEKALIIPSTADEWYLPTAVKLCRQMSIYPSYKDDTIKKIFIDELEYFRFLVKAGNKTVVNAEVLKLANDITSLFNDVIDQWMFDSPKEAISTKIYYQTPIYFKIQDIPCKALPDIVIEKIYPNNHKEVEIIDIKTSYEYPFNFNSAFYRNGYNLQCAMYNMAVKEIIKADRYVNYIYVGSNQNTLYKPSKIKVDPDVIQRAIYGVPEHYRIGYLMDEPCDNPEFQTQISATKGILDIITLAGQVSSILHDDSISIDLKKSAVYNVINDNLSVLVRNTIL